MFPLSPRRELKPVRPPYPAPYGWFPTIELAIFSVPPLSAEALAPSALPQEWGAEGWRTKDEDESWPRQQKAACLPLPCSCPLHFSEGGPASWVVTLPTPVLTPTASSTSGSGDERWSSFAVDHFFVKNNNNLWC